MSNNYRWKDNATEIDGTIIPFKNPIYMSIIGHKNGNGTKNNPYPFKALTVINKTILLSSGYLKEELITSDSYTIGQGIKNTILNKLRAYGGYIAHCTIETFYSTSGTLRPEFCEILFPFHQARIQPTNCIIRKDLAYEIYRPSNSFLGIFTSLDKIFGHYSLLGDSEISVSASDIKSKYTLYLAFSNCRFKIAEETEYTPLVGNTEEELRADFAARCEAQGIVVPEGSELNDPKIKLYRWVFSNDKNDHGYVIKDSIIDKFQQRRMIRFGWKNEPVSPIEITTDTTKINSLSTKTEEILIDDENQSIRFADNIDIANMDNGAQTGKVRSNIIWMGEGKQKLDSVNIFHNLATQYGVMIDSDPAIVPVGRNSIEGGQMYLVRTKAAGKQSIIYNEKSYSTSLADANNIFIGVDGVNDWICDDYDSIVIYKITDLAISNTIRMRIVDEIPEDTITSVAKDVWYFVQPKDLSNPSGSVIYDGAEYPCFGSFKAENETSFQIKGDCRLRRCWKDDFELSTDPDKKFWENKQKPIWFDVVPDDMRCLLKKNNPLSVEMEWDKDRNTYITSGHPDFYAMVAADNGVPRPAYDITGKYLQIELVISTLNPM
ncbi:hypothetical protein [Dysgonomonas massiliensis]|uniref:hypothetical protein n=1 Tax=Dysgonomonas massiliensis TaxID=2040292 RepID=UPI000C781DAE|nr:hypothetical protein [Dysgonomonas massiliensis]